MTSAVEAAVAAAHAAVSAVAGQTVTYRRLSDSAEVELTAVPGSTRVESVDAEGQASSHRLRDWLVATAELLIDGAVHEPAAGDTIRVASGDAVEVYQVCRVGPGCWQFSDPAHARRRVHAQWVATE